MLRGRSGDGLLDTYETERKPNVHAFIDLAVRVQTVISLAEISERTGVMCYFDAEKRLIHDGITPPVKNWGRLLGGA